MEINKQFIWYDIAVIIIILLFQGARILTNLITVQTSMITKTEIEQVFTAVESNPVAKILFNFEGTAVILSYIIIPATIIATYIYFRTKVKKNKMDIDALAYIVNLLLITSLLDVINDASILVGVMMK